MKNRFIFFALTLNSALMSGEIVVENILCKNENERQPCRYVKNIAGYIVRFFSESPAIQHEKHELISLFFNKSNNKIFFVDVPLVKKKLLTWYSSSKKKCETRMCIHLFIDGVFSNFFCVQLNFFSEGRPSVLVFVPNDHSLADEIYEKGLTQLFLALDQVLSYKYSLISSVCYSLALTGFGGGIGYFLNEFKSKMPPRLQSFKNLATEPHSAPVKNRIQTSPASSIQLEKQFSRFFPSGEEVSPQEIFKRIAHDLDIKGNPHLIAAFFVYILKKLPDAQVIEFYSLYEKSDFICNEHVRRAFQSYFFLSQHNIFSTLLCDAQLLENEEALIKKLLFIISVARRAFKGVEAKIFIGSLAPTGITQGEESGFLCLSFSVDTSNGESYSIISKKITDFDLAVIPDSFSCLVGLESFDGATSTDSPLRRTSMSSPFSAGRKASPIQEASLLSWIRGRIVSRPAKPIGVASTTQESPSSLEAGASQKGKTPLHVKIPSSDEIIFSQPFIFDALAGADQTCFTFVRQEEVR